MRDRFTFVEWGIEDASRYYYLGVRQSSNLTTTGAMDRIAAEAYIRILGDRAKTNTFGNWALQLFPNCQLGIGFDDFSPTPLDRFLSNPEEWVKKQFGRVSSSRWTEEKLLDAKKAMPNIKRLFHFLQEYGQHHESNSGKLVRQGTTRILQPQKLSLAAHEEFGGLRQSFSLASSLRLIGRPSFMLNTGAWMDFTQLSSGEQNLLATGARLIGYATPGSFIVIDEPEVSLNVAWQQRYIELILGALEHAHGSHVFIASHSPYLVADLRAGNATVVVVERRGKELNFKSHPGRFWGWGSEAILYEVLGLPSASNYHFSRELAAILKLVENDSKDAIPFRRFLEKCDQLDLPVDAEPLRLVIEEIRMHYKNLNA